MRTKITKRTVDAAQVSERDVFIWDTETKGFGLKVTPAGNKVYLTQARVKNTGQLVRCTIGKHGSPWTPEMARNEAVKLLGQIASGVNPNEAQKAARRDLTMAKLCDLYVAEGCATKKPSTIASDCGRIERHIKPLLGRKYIRDVTREDVERIMREIAGGKTKADIKTKPRGRAIVKGGRGVATKTIMLLGAIFTFAVDRGMREDNPTRGIRTFKPNRHERFLSPKELARLGEVMSQSEFDFHAAEERARRGLARKSGRRNQSDPPAGENPFAIAAIRLLMLTGCRKNEVLSLRWDWVDFQHNMLRLPDSKTGAKVIPLASPAIDLLRQLPRVEGNPHVFPSSKGDGHFVGLQKVWARVRKKAGLADVRIHDLRHSFASVGASGGDSLYVIGKLLGHRQSATTQRYAHLADDPVRAAAERIAQQVAAAMNSGDRENIINDSARP